MAEDISGKILQAVKYGIQSSLKTLPVDKTYVGTVIEVLGTKQYLVKYDDAERKISTTNEIGLSVGDVVHITYPQNDASKKYIKEDVASGSGGSTVSGVSSVDGLTGVVVLKNKYASKTSEHTHNNKTVLDKLSESNGTLMYNGSEISGGGSSATALSTAKNYTDTKVADLINGAPETLDTLKEISDAIAENESVVEALNDAIGTKANATDLTNHTENTDIHITSTERTNWNTAYTNNHTHSNKTVLDNTTASYITAEKTKLSGIENGAEVNNISDTNATDLTDGGDTTLHYHATDRNRANHTGTQLASTISDFASTVRSTVLTGLSTATNAVISATDTVLSALGKLQKQISDNLATLTNHTSNKSNPHSVTKTQVGLSDVPNVTTNNQTPSYTMASGNADLVSGETLTIAFGKIAKSINSLIAHIADNIRHITSTERTNWNVSYTNNHTHSNKTILDNTTASYTATDKTKLDGIESGAQVNDVTGVKGDSEGSYRVGNVNITKTNIGLGSVDNTSDATKPVSTPQQTALNLKLDKTGDSKDNVTTFTQSATLTVINTGEKHSVMFGKIKKAIADLISHIGNTTNPHSVTKTQVGLGNVDNTSDATKKVLSATKLTTARTINGVSFDGTANVTVADATKLPLSGGNMTGAINFASSSPITWDSATYRQRINAIDDSIVDTNVFEFQQSIDSGVTYPTLLAIKDNGNIVPSGSFIGSLIGNASTSTSASKLTTARTISLTGDVTGSVSFDGSGNSNIVTTVVDDSHNHIISNVDNLQTTLNIKADLVDGKVPSSQLPSFVDDVLEYETLSVFPTTGTSGIIYVDLSTNLAYRWSGTVYVEISPSLALGETSSTAYRGDRGVIAYNHSLSKSNPHSTTASQVGLGNVPNVTTNNQTPTFTMAGTDSNLVSGETLTISLGKISKAINSLISHIADTVKHITAAERTLWNSKTKVAPSTTNGNIIVDDVETTVYTLPSDVAKTTDLHSHSNKTTLDKLSENNGTLLFDGNEIQGGGEYTLPTASNTTLGGVKTTSTVTDASGYTSSPIIAGVPYYKDTNTTYSAGTGLSLSGTTFSNSGVRSVATGTANGTVRVNTNGTSVNVPVYGLGSAAYTDSSAYATSRHTHNYAGSSSTGGAATTALACTGNSATSTKATKDASGNTITASYASSLTASGNTLTLKSKSGATLSTVTVSGGSSFVYGAEPSTKTSDMVWIED